MILFFIIELKQEKIFQHTLTLQTIFNEVKLIKLKQFKSNKVKNELFSINSQKK